MGVDAPADVSLDVRDESSDAGVDAGLDVGDVNHDMSGDVSDVDVGMECPPVSEECEWALEGGSQSFCGASHRELVKCWRNHDGCVVAERDECPPRSYCDQGKCSACDEGACQSFDEGEILNCITLPEDLDQMFSTCRADEETGCLVFENQACDPGLVCVFPAPPDGPCQPS